MESLAEHSKVNKKPSRVLVMAGTPVDTKMGVAALAAYGIDSIGVAMAQTPQQQTAFQCQRAANRHAQVRGVLKDMAQRGSRQVFVYCNSLAGAVDFDALAKETGLQIVTPLTVYWRWAQRYRALGVWAANAQGLAGIERTLYAANPQLTLWGTALFPVVEAIEGGRAAKDIVARFQLAAQAAWLERLGAEAVLLGCTHFPYIKEVLAAQCGLQFLEPTEDMVRMIQQGDAQGGEQV